MVKNTKELLDNIVISKTNKHDILEIACIIDMFFSKRGLSDALSQLKNFKIDIDNSIKIIDKRDNKIYGILLFSNMDILYGSPIDPRLGVFLKNKAQINGFCLIVDKRLRGYSLDKKMMDYAHDFLSKYDFIWFGVENNDRILPYWERIGAYKFITYDDINFFIKFKDKNFKNDIFILKSLLE